MNIEDVFVETGRIIGIVGDRDSGKSNLMYYAIQALQKKYKFNLFSYGLRINLGEQRIYSVRELENVSNGIVFIDEFPTLFKLDNRKIWRDVESTFQFISHKNIVMVLAGLPENYHKFIAAKLQTVIYKTCAIDDFINRSKIKTVLDRFTNPMKGSEMLTIEKDECLIYDGEHFHPHVKVPYVQACDTKQHRPPIFVPKIVPDIEQELR